MAFWGVEVKPDKPITHLCEKSKGRLRISQATLGIGGARVGSDNASESETRKKPVVVQCNVGTRSPVFLCALIPTKTESCHLDLEFEEADDVVFSVIGLRSVYLTGYYVQRSKQLDPHSDTETFGMDIENTQTEGSSYFSDDENYEDSFINDDTLFQFSPRSPVNNNGMDEQTLENDKKEDKKGLRRQRTKKYRVIQSDSDAKTHESEDGDGDSLSALKSKNALDPTISDDSLSAVKSKNALDPTISDSGEKIPPVLMEMEDELKVDSACGIEPNEKVDQLDINGKQEGVIKLSLNDERTEVVEEKTEVVDEKNEVPNEVETSAEMIVCNEKVLTGDTTHETNVEDSIINQRLPMGNENDQMKSPDIAKSKRKRKKHNKEYKDHSVHTHDKEHEIETPDNMDVDINSEDGQKSKKRKNEVPLEESEQGLQNADDLERDFSVANREENQEQLGLSEIYTEEIGSESHDIPKEDNKSMLFDLPHADIIKEDLPTESGEEYQKQQIDNIINTINKEILASDSQPEKKIKKKKKKTPGKDLKMDSADVKDSNEITLNEDKAIDAEPNLTRTLPNGLIIEELARGPPDGKVAALGKKIKIHYTGMLKENGYVFDDSDCRFKLGDEEFIDGWNVGIDGMRVGDKRRLIIPPSMGFGDQDVGNVPPNSWLVYDVELLAVRK